MTIPNAARRRIRSAADILADDTIEPRRGLLGDLILERGLTLIYAPSGIGKSLISLGMAFAVAAGASIGRWEAPAPRRVLLIDGELDMADLQSRLAKLLPREDDGETARRIMVWARKDQPLGEDVPPFIDLGTEDGRQEVVAYVLAARPDLVVLDNVSTLVTVADENSAAAWTPFLATLLEMQRAGASVLVVHHAKKAGGADGGYRGSQKLSVLFDRIIRLEVRPDALNVNGAAFDMVFEKSRQVLKGERGGFHVSFEVDDATGRQTWRFEPREDSRLLEIVAGLKALKYPTQDAIAKEYGVSKGTVSKWKQDAIAKGLIAGAAWSEYLAAAKEDREEPAAGGARESVVMDF